MDLLADHLAAEPFDAALVLPAGVVEASLDRDHVTLLLILGDRLAQAVEEGDLVELGLLGGVAGLRVLVALALVIELHPVGGDDQRGRIDLQRIASSTDIVARPADGKINRPGGDVCHAAVGPRDGTIGGIEVDSTSTDI